MFLQRKPGGLAGLPFDKYDTWTTFHVHTEVFPWNWSLMLSIQCLLICNLELSEKCFNYLKSSVFTMATGKLLLMHEKIQSWLNLFGLLITFELKNPPGSVWKPKEKLILMLLLILLNRKLKGKAESILHTCKKDVPLQCLILTDMSIKLVHEGMVVGGTLIESELQQTSEEFEEK